MDKLILEFDTDTEALTCLTAINELSALWWVSQGYSVIDGVQGKELIGKNAASGEDDPLAQRIISWDVVSESPDTTYYITSLSSDTRFPDWKLELSNYGFMAIGNERVKPSAWDVNPTA